jgi:nucleotide-binding universal stress UspA family protein
MGTHGRRGVRRLLMGSDAELVLHSTRVPVLMIRGPIEQAQ